LKFISDNWVSGNIRFQRTSSTADSEIIDEINHVLHAFNIKRKEANKGRGEGRGFPGREGMLLGWWSCL